MAKNAKGGTPTSEKDMLTDIIKNVREKIKETLKLAESGGISTEEDKKKASDSLSEQVAMIKIFEKELGNTTEKAVLDVSSAMQARYSDNAKKRLGGTSSQDGQEKGVGPGHSVAIDLQKQILSQMKAWDPEIFGEKIAKSITLETKANKTINTNKKNSFADQKINDVKNTDTYKAELSALTQKVKSVADISDEQRVIEQRTLYQNTSDSGAEQLAIS